MLGLGYNNKKLVVGNFIIIFGTQILFSLNDLMSTPEAWPSSWWLCKTVLTSVIATAIFYGYNKITAKP